ncbi:AAA family ATPase [Desulforamulus aquiferis]|uniref:Nuclease SbcCD subunit C n=1 Tax=Desulforamulus aquiferis TaxID=1397668 RepID=A0AAW7ZJI9_9FIRM|nr:SMC family ATPase [Desulforamulus aquiferis]MDO7789133.1 SMC family ATPase [Desulforamulus aquiferis]
MIPLRIQVANFGAIPYSDIDLRNVTLAAIIGVNGAGKSTAFTTAPRFALFGGTKNGVSADEMVRKGTQEMAVTFEFEHREETYRTTRTRSIKGKGKTTLELQKFIGTDWISLSGTTIRETEEKIRELLSLDDEIFTASSMILQGKANEFTSKPAGQRKGILQQILGLGIYDRLLEKAREKERATGAELDALKRKLTELEEQLQAKSSINDQLVLANQNITEITDDIEAKEVALKDAEELVRNLTVRAEKAEELRKLISALDGEIDGCNTERTRHQEVFDRTSNILAREADILAKAKEYEQIKEQVAALQLKQPRLAEWKAEENRISSEIGRADEQIRKLSPQIKELDTLLSDRVAIQQAAMEYQETSAELKVMDDLADKWLSLNTQALEAERKAVNWGRGAEADLVRLKSTIEAKQGQVATLDKVTCKGTEMANTCPLLAGARRAAEEIAEAEKELSRLNQNENPYVAEWQALLSKRDGLEYESAKHRQLKDHVNNLRTKADLAGQLEAKAETLKTLKEQKAQADESKLQIAERLASVQEWIKQLINSLAPLAMLEARLPKLKQWVEYKDKLPEAKAAQAAATERITALNQEIALKEEKIRILAQEQLELLSGDISSFEAEKQVKENREQLSSLRSELGLKQALRGKLEAQMESLELAEKERSKIASEMGWKSKTLSRWQTLVRAFGRDGIPALIIENAVPELERIANEILGQMSKGEHSLRFETQKELKSKSGVSETLDIIVNDWAGERPYETFSGGEQLRIDFAIRFALAELLARRAGAKIEWLTIDEGLGSQDAEHRGLVLEAIKAVSDRFRKTLVITHIEEAQAMFEQRIYFEPQDDGVEIKVA